MKPERIKAVQTCLWFNDQALAAAEFYTSLVPDSKILQVKKKDDENVLVVDFILGGQNYAGLNGGDYFQLTEAVSIVLQCENQAEVDFYWDALLADGGEESQCGWLKDRFGLSWQITPVQLLDYLHHPDPAVHQAVMEKMYTMKKINIAELHQAAAAAVAGAESGEAATAGA